MARYICYKWNCPDSPSVWWKNADWKWSECQLVDEVIGGLPKGVPGEWALPPWLQDQYDPYNQQNKEKRERFIRLIAKVKDKEYDEKKKVNPDIKISIDDIKMVVKAVKGIDVQVTEE
jgi:hypothetical protein